MDIVNCPMLNDEIDIAYCIELQMISDQYIKPTLDEKDLTKDHFKICQKCEKRQNY